MPACQSYEKRIKEEDVKHLKVVYSKEKPVRPIEDMGISCRTNCICPPGAAHKCTERRDIPGSTAFVPSVAGLIIASEVLKILHMMQWLKLVMKMVLTLKTDSGILYSTTHLHIKLVG